MEVMTKYNGSREEGPPERVRKTMQKGQGSRSDSKGE